MSRTSVSPGVQRDRRHGRHREVVMRRDKGLCHLCGEPHADAIDHIVPVDWGGSDDPSNLAPAHTSCNSSKGARHYPSWAEDVESMWLPEYLPAKIKEAQARERRNAKRRLARKKAKEQAQREAIEAHMAIRPVKPDLPRWMRDNETLGSSVLWATPVLTFAGLMLLSPLPDRLGTGWIVGIALVASFCLWGLVGLVWGLIEFAPLGRASSDEPTQIVRFFMPTRCYEYEQAAISWNETRPEGCSPIQVGERQS